MGFGTIAGSRLVITQKCRNVRARGKKYRLVPH